jgi:hypothetical protein
MIKNTVFDPNPKTFPSPFKTRECPKPEHILMTRLLLFGIN